MSQFEVKAWESADDVGLERQADIIKKSALGYEYKSELYLELSDKKFIDIVVFILVYESKGETKAVRRLLNKLDENSQTGLKESFIEAKDQKMPLTEKAQRISLNRISGVIEKSYNLDYQTASIAILNKAHEGSLRVSQYNPEVLVNIKGFNFKAKDGIREDIAIVIKDEKAYLCLFSSESCKGLRDSRKEEKKEEVVPKKKEEKGEESAVKKEQPETKQVSPKKKIEEEAVMIDPKKEQVYEEERAEGQSRQADCKDYTCFILLLLVLILLVAFTFTPLRQNYLNWRNQ